MVCCTFLHHFENVFLILTINCKYAVANPRRNILEKPLPANDIFQTDCSNHLKSKKHRSFLRQNKELLISPVNGGDKKAKPLMSYHAREELTQQWNATIRAKESSCKWFYVGITNGQITECGRTRRVPFQLNKSVAELVCRSFTKGTDEMCMAMNGSQFLEQRY